jgi:hypothetical protein
MYEGTKIRWMIEVEPMNNAVFCDPNVSDISGIINCTIDNCSFTRRGRAFLPLPTISTLGANIPRRAALLYQLLGAGPEMIQ